MYNAPPVPVNHGVQGVIIEKFCVFTLGVPNFRLVTQIP